MAQLIVPIRDRRQSRRIVTLKNTGPIAIALAVLFIGLTIHSEMGKTDATNYGRLFGKQVAGQTEVAKPRYDIVKETPVADQTAADPMLMEPAARAQQLGIGLEPIAPPTTSVATAAAAPSNEITHPQVPVVQSSTASGVSIVGGSDGVQIVKGTDSRRPTLAGGIFKPN